MISRSMSEISENHQITNLMKTTNFRTVEELNLDVNAPTVTPTKVQNDKIVRALKKLSVADPDETMITKMVSAFVALGINPQAKSSSWLARRLRNHLQAFGLVGAPTTGPVVAPDTAQAVQESAEVTAQESPTERQEPMLEHKARAAKKAAKKE
jgi:hypothetical protein